MENTNNEKQKYIFIRLYDTVYKGDIALQALKRGIKLTSGPNKDGHLYTHSSINFDLKDQFYGATAYGEFIIKQESCENILSNTFMSKCKAEESYFKIIAIPVTDQEYNKIKSFIVTSSTNKELKYSILKALKVGLDGVSLESSSTQYSRINKIVCSTFVALCFERFCTKIRNFFKKKNTDYSHIAPGNLTSLPGAKDLGGDMWNNYTKFINKLCEKNPEFVEYK